MVDEAVSKSESPWEKAILMIANPVLESDDIRQALTQAETSVDNLRGLIIANTQKLFMSAAGGLTFSREIDWNAVRHSQGAQTYARRILLVLAVVVTLGVIGRGFPYWMLALFYVPLIAGGLFMSFLLFLTADSLRGPFRMTVGGEEFRREVIGPFVREQINLILDRGEHPALMRVTSAPGLSALSGREQFVATRALRDLERLARDISSGSIGVSGPRGVGKTTLLRYFCDPSFEAAERNRDGALPAQDIRLMVAAPVNYNAREFILHIFGKLCSEACDGSSGKRLQAEARSSIRKIKYQYSFTAGSSGSLGLPRGLQIGVTRSRQLSELPMTLPELVDTMRDFATRVIKERQERTIRERQVNSTSYKSWLAQGRQGDPLAPPPRQAADSSGSQLKRFFIRGDLPASLPRKSWDPSAGSRPRIIIGIDEVDKIDSGFARQFLNEVKAIFGMPDCLYLASVSDGVLETYERRTLLGRTAFDSAFDEIIRVPPLDFGACRNLLRRRIAGIPDSLIAFCQVMAGGVPRDMIRVARKAIDASAQGQDQIAEIASDLVTAEIDVIKQAFISEFDQPGPNATEFPAAALKSDWPGRSPNGIIQSLEADLKGASFPPSFRAGLYFYATVAEAFSDMLPDTIRQLRSHQFGDDPWIDQLAQARNAISVNPAVAWEMITRYRAARKIHVIEARTGLS